MPKQKRSGRRTISVSSRSKKKSATSRGKKRKKKSTAGNSTKKSKVTTMKQKSMALEEKSKRNRPALVRLAKKMGNRFVDTVHGRKARKTVVKKRRNMQKKKRDLPMNVYPGESGGYKISFSGYCFGTYATKKEVVKTVEEIRKRLTPMNNGTGKGYTKKSVEREHAKWKKKWQKKKEEESQKKRGLPKNVHHRYGDKYVIEFSKITFGIYAKNEAIRYVEQIRKKLTRNKGRVPGYTRESVERESKKWRKFYEESQKKRGLPKNVSHNYGNKYAIRFSKISFGSYVKNEAIKYVEQIRKKLTPKKGPGPGYTRESIERESKKWRKFCEKKKAR